MDVVTSPKHNVPMKSAEIIAEEESPKHNVETACAKTLEESNVEEIKTVETRDEDVYPKPIVETEDIIDEMESIDIHNEDKTVSLECETQQDKMLSPSNDDDDDDEHDSESSHDSKDDVDEDETMDGKEKPKPDSPDSNPSTSAWTEKAAAIKKFVRLKSEVAVHTVMRRLSGRMNDENGVYDARDDATKSVESPKTEGKSSIWNPLSYLKMMQNDTVDKVEVKNVEEAELEPVVMKGRIILYTRLGCEACRECRLYLHGKRLRYVEINIDIYPSRKQDLEKIGGSSSSDVPKVFFNEELVGSVKEIKELDESGELDEKIKHLIDEASPREAPLPPFSGEDDASSKGSDAVDFLSSDQCLERDEAIEVARKLASQLFFQHVLEENLFEDGNHLYRFLDDDHVVSSQCHNIPRGIIEIKPRPIAEIASRLRLLYRAILEAYTSPDGKHVDYRSIHGSEEFARYLRIIQELHRDHSNERRCLGSSSM